MLRMKTRRSLRIFTGFMFRYSGRRPDRPGSEFSYAGPGQGPREKESFGGVGRRRTRQSDFTAPRFFSPKLEDRRIRPEC